MNFNKLKYLIVEDEEPTANRLREELIRWETTNGNKNIQVDIADSPKNAVSEYLTEKHDIIFLDINLQGQAQSGYHDVLQKIRNKGHDLPYIVVTTGATNLFKDYASNQPKYNPNIIGFWEKPYFEDIDDKLDEVLRNLRELGGLINSNQEASSYIDIKTKVSVERVFLDDMVFLEAAGNCTDIYLANQKKLVVTKQLGQYANILPMTLTPYYGFYKVSRSLIINKAHFAQLKRQQGVHNCIFRNGASVIIPPSRLADFKRHMQIP